jgi:hypothetical protein
MLLGSAQLGFTRQLHQKDGVVMLDGIEERQIISFQLCMDREASPGVQGWAVLDGAKIAEAYRDLFWS